MIIDNSSDVLEILMFLISSLSGFLKCRFLWDLTKSRPFDQQSARRQAISTIAVGVALGAIAAAFPQVQSDVAVGVGRGGW